MGQNSSQPEGIPEISEDFGIVVPETPYAEHDTPEPKKRDKKNRHSKKREKLSQSDKANGIGTPPSDDNATKSSKRKREDEPERKKSKKKNRKDDARHEAESPSPPRAPFSSQATSSMLERSEKKAHKSSKQKRDSNGITPPASQVSRATPAAKGTPDSKQQMSEEGKNSVRGPRIREADNKKIGFYTPEELEKIESYKVTFCNWHGVSGLTFDELVHHSERGSQDWPLPTTTMTKSEFWDEIYALLPGRDRRSVYRFMRRHFQGSTQRAHDWSPEQDEELIELHAQHGPKWTYIGKLLGRSDDDVYQRWKNRLRYKDTMKRGAWSAEETKLFLEAMQAVWETLRYTLSKEEKRKSLGKDLYEMDETLVPWGTISSALDNKRSEQQCSDKFRKIRPVVMRMRANGNPDAVFDYETSAKRARNWNRKIGEGQISEQYVNDDDSDVDRDADEVKETPGPQPTRTQGFSGIVREISHGPSQETDAESEFESAKQSKKSKKSKKNKHAEDPNTEEQAVSFPKLKEEKKREKKERREKEKQENTENEVTAEKALRKERKKQKKEEKKRREEEERRAAGASSSEAESEPKQKKAKESKSKKVSSEADHRSDGENDNTQSPFAAPSPSFAKTDTPSVHDESESDKEEEDGDTNMKLETDSE
ncbi:hypothetical protein PENANT_c009G00751 [Penicillium antarcticum]|uniref:Myb-like domain-containing protein n=1 Tax=Penicillium antarcticum TaxID=416450 RepID=A0A1V6Q9E4_9EURO|nr:hypothetical protein PENANT_c009G00751 [Penicillium antarcticum]